MHSVILIVIAIIALVILVAGPKESYESSSQPMDMDARTAVIFAWNMYAVTYAKTLDPAGKKRFKEIQTKLGPIALGTMTEAKNTFDALSAADKALLSGFFVKTISTLETARTKLTPQDTKMMLDIAKDMLSQIQIS